MELGGATPLVGYHDVELMDGGSEPLVDDLRAGLLPALGDNLVLVCVGQKSLGKEQRRKDEVKGDIHYFVHLGIFKGLIS